MCADIRAISRLISPGPARLNPILARKIAADRERHAGPTSSLAIKRPDAASPVKIAFRLTLMKYLIESQEAFETCGRQRLATDISMFALDFTPLRA